MTIQNINIGNIANDGTGDDLREAFRKVNENFDELDLRQPESTTGAGIGSGVSVFAGKVGHQLQFNNLTAGAGVAVQSVAGNDIQISANLQGMLVVTDAGSMNVDDGETLRIIGGAGITTGLSGNTLTITDTSSEGSEVFSTQLEFGSINPNITSHAEYMQLNFDIDYGTITVPVTYGTDLGAIAV
tara:strand:- start:1110 stop:1667 length:558 start_codon:yes stop_codon:yes gene_type:complete